MLFVSHVDWLYTIKVVNCCHWPMFQVMLFPLSLTCSIGHSLRVHSQLNTLCSRPVLYLSLAHNYIRYFLPTLFPLQSAQMLTPWPLLYCKNFNSLIFDKAQWIFFPIVPLRHEHQWPQWYLQYSLKYLGQMQGNVGSTLVRATHKWSLRIHINPKAMYSSYPLTLPRIYWIWVYALESDIFIFKYHYTLENPQNVKGEVKEGRRVF